MKKLFACFLVSATMLTSVVPVQAAPVVPTKPVASASSDVQLVRKKRIMRRHNARASRQGWRNGHRGYRNYRSGYRRHNGLWFPLAAFTAGAVIGGAVSTPSRAYSGRSNSRHVNWCENRYRSYRAWDNTFQPNYGSRKQCVSPYY